MQVSIVRACEREANKGLEGGRWYFWIPPPPRAPSPSTPDHRTALLAADPLYLPLFGWRAATWPEMIDVDQGAGAYSSMALVNISTLGLLYESGGYSSVTFATISGLPH
jgi:hypothetical protein